jgi:tRNA pseudouridine55 synthase
MTPAMKHGLLLVDKQPGCTSHDVVQRVRRILGEKKIGHCGTLDPDATGLLVLTVGWATRLTRFLIRAPKVYEGSIRFGVATDTYDAAGEPVAEASTAGLTREAVETAMHGLEGTIRHLAPPYSAKKHKGMKYYEMARRGEETPREEKEVTVYELAPLGELTGDVLAFRLACSSGTYARTLAHEVGRAVGTGAHLCRLRRTRVGPFEVDAAVTLEALREQVEKGEEAGGWWIPFDRIPLPFSEVVADARQEQRIDHGQTVLVRDLGGEEGDWVKLIDRRQRFLAVGSVVERIGGRGVAIVQPRIVFK